MNHFEIVAQLEQLQYHHKALELILRTKEETCAVWVFGSRIETLRKHLRSGQRLLLSGHITARRGSKRRFLNAIADQVLVADGLPLRNQVTLTGRLAQHPKLEGGMWRFVVAVESEKSTYFMPVISRKAPKADKGRTLIVQGRLTYQGLPENRDWIIVSDALSTVAPFQEQPALAVTG